LLPRVQGFSCGPEDYAREVAEWIQGARGTSGALDDMENLETEVWLYETEDGDLVGFSSLGVTEMRYPNPSKSRPVPVLVVPNFGIAVAYRGFPPGSDKSKRYSRLIFADLMEKASRHPSGLNIIGLVVHPVNTGAIKFYADFGFRPFGKPRRDGYIRMLRENLQQDNQP
jgi:hypothetical protein